MIKTEIINKINKNNIVYSFKQLIAALSYLFLSFIKNSNNEGGEKKLFVEMGNIGDILIKIFALNTLDSNNLFLIRTEFKDLFHKSKLNKQIIFIDLQKYKYNLFYKLSFLNSMNNYHIKTIINLTAARTITVEELTLLIPAEERIAFKNTFKCLKKFNESFWDRKYHKILDYNTINEYAKMESFFVDNKITRDNSPKDILNIDKNILNKYGLEAGKYYCFAPFASEVGNDWGVEKTIQLIELFAKKNESIILFGSRNQIGILKNDFDENLVKNLIGKTKLYEIATLLVYSKAFVGFDSGLTHMASLINVKSYCILGGGMFNHFFPNNSDNTFCYFRKLDCFNCEWRCIYDRKKCFDELDEHELFNIITKELN